MFQGPTVSVAIASAVMEKTYRRKTYQYKLRDSKVDELRKLSEFLVEDYRVTFKQAYGNMLEVLSTKEDPRLMFTFAQFYDPTLHCFTFQDFLLPPTLEEFAHLLQLPVKDQAPYMIEDNFPDSADIAQALCMKKDLIESTLQIKGNTQGLPSKLLFENATLFSNSGSWDAFYASFALLICGLVLFPSVKGFVDKTSINIFISQNPVPTLLVYVLFSFHWRNMKKGGTISCCIPLLQNWIMSHLLKKGPFIDNVGNLKWSQRLMSLDAKDIIWYSLNYLRIELIFQCGEFPNVPLVSTKWGLINYSHILSLRQLGYPLKEKPKDRLLEELLLAEEVENPKLMKKMRRAWGKIQRVGKKELGKQLCTVTVSYANWVKSMAKMIKLPYAWELSTCIKKPHAVVVSEVDRLKETIKKLEKENVGLRSSLIKVTS
ncbi:uncharacterized protein LOC127137319 [Lathyrus oleraceus]|uniref:uncharacterized protein LOC127137319 n=1 Tax=Pisum sativum TaxID=3888 RepID=UPI0021D36B30|nr:uncharacterized protein LOC127137319 [Pisum sativum]